MSRQRNKWRSLIHRNADRPAMLDGTRHKYYGRIFCFLMNIIDPRVPCKYGCKWIAPFGYMRNSSCPRHD